VGLHVLEAWPQALRFFWQRCPLGLGGESLLARMPARIPPK
jgi:hypothetical protein